MDVRFGIGYDVHRLVTNRKLILGGVEIPYLKGLVGHSDADVLCHAFADALLGAAALGDIGKHFPDTDTRFKDISSLVLLRHVGGLVRSNNFEIINVDSTLLLQQPKINPSLLDSNWNAGNFVISPTINVYLKVGGFTEQEACDKKGLTLINPQIGL